MKISKTAIKKITGVNKDSNRAQILKELWQKVTNIKMIYSSTWHLEKNFVFKYWLDQKPSLSTIMSSVFQLWFKANTANFFFTLIMYDEQTIEAWIEK